ncbi:MAG: hypothetical protein JO097_21970 [Acidobacteriaceae bacterium]|nr:hypothetical protein [Acidobacteriaceae bacterium]MBV9296387.1 hypothetical protein [Acidobacteriaceae bacterium]MBV9763637.1 hypothetical protein [Acidobacteriaceae bacterium]
MNNYSPTVSKIITDYLERVRSKLRLLPANEQEEFVKELHSHIYEAYQKAQDQDDVAKILSVLRNLGEPAEVVSDRLPGAMVRSGSKRKLPLYILGGIFIALFGIPLGFGGVGVLLGLLFALTGVLIAYYAAAGSILLGGGVFGLLGVIRVLLPELWERLVTLGFIQIDGPVGDFLAHFPASDQGLFIILFASLFIVAGLGMLRGGRYLLRGLRFLFNLVFEWMRRFAQSIRRKLRQKPGPAPIFSQSSRPFEGPYNARFVKF